MAIKSVVAFFATTLQETGVIKCVMYMQDLDFFFFFVLEFECFKDKSFTGYEFHLDLNQGQVRLDKRGRDQKLREPRKSLP